MQKFDHNIGFREKRQFFRRKLSKVEENCDHNIDPRATRLDYFSTIVLLFYLASFKKITELAHILGHLFPLVKVMY
jgi:hypothetical protein